MLLLIGLGNPGKEYEKTRHNAGFIVLDQLREKWKFSDFTLDKKFKAETSEGTLGSKKIILVKPQTFMNLSGDCVRKFLDFYKITAKEIIVLHDDLDILLGTVRVAVNSSSAGHNGVQDIIEKIGTQEFKRFRIGLGKSTVDTPACRLGAHDFVLRKFSLKELDEISALLPEIEKNILESQNSSN